MALDNLQQDQEGLFDGEKKQLQKSHFKHFEHFTWKFNAREKSKHGTYLPVQMRTCNIPILGQMQVRYFESEITGKRCKT